MDGATQPNSSNSRDDGRICVPRVHALGANRRPKWPSSNLLRCTGVPKWIDIDGGINRCDDLSTCDKSDGLPCINSNAQLGKQASISTSVIV